MMTLATFINQQRDVPFAWGTHDCCLFVADYLLAIDSSLGDIAAPFRGRYHSQLSAFKVLRDAGLHDLETTFNHLLGSSCSVLALRRGDVVLLETPDGDVMGLFGGSQCFALAQHGVVAYPKQAIKMGWQIHG